MLHFLLFNSKKRSLLTSIMIVLVTGIIISASNQVFAAGKEDKLLILPFRLNGPSEMNHIQQGAMAMLNSRLAIPEEIEVVSAEQTTDIKQQTPMTQSAALILAQQAKADFVLYGSISFFGNSVSTDSLLLNVQEGVVVKSYSQTVDSIEKLQSQFVSLSDSVRNTISSSINPGNDIVKETVTTSKAVTKTSGTQKLSKRSNNVEIDMTLNGVAVGDFDGDGRNEVCVTSENSLVLYRWNEGKLDKLDSMKVGTASTVLGISAADVNGNGRTEIFVSSYHNLAENLSSFVVEWDGNEFIKVQDKIKWFLNTASFPGDNGKHLIGQQIGTRAFYSKSGVSELVWDGKMYKPSSQSVIPKGLNIYGVATGYFFDKEEMQIATISNDSKLLLLNQKGEIEWRSTYKGYGGSETFIEIDPSRIGEPTNGDSQYRVYMEQNILPVSRDNGLQDLFVIRNVDTESMGILQSRDYNSTSVELLSWDQNEVSVLWSTGNLAGYISGFTYEDITNDGVPDIVAIHVEKTGGMQLFSDDKSLLRVWQSQ